MVDEALDNEKECTAYESGIETSMDTLLEQDAQSETHTVMD